MAFFSMVNKKAVDSFQSNLRDVEVQMLPKPCTAILKYPERKRKQNNWIEIHKC